MAGSRIKGITIEINGETKGLSKSLEGVNSQIKETSAKLKDVERLLKMDPGNTELLKQKQQYLADAIAETKEKLDQEKEALRQLQEAGNSEETIEAQRALQREITATEGSLKKLEDSAKQSNVALESMKATADKVANSAGRLSENAKTMSTVAAGALGALVGVGLKAASDADDLNTMAKQTGFTTAELQKMSYASDLVDVSLESITGAARKMKSKISSSEESFEAIGVSVRDANGEFRSTNDIFMDCVSALGSIENETERDTVAMSIFGKSADELAGILDDGGASLKALGEEASQNGLIIPQEDLDAANELNDTMDKLKATLGGSFGVAAVSVMTALAPVMEKVAIAVSGIADKLKDVSPDTIQMVAIILAIIAAISPVAGIISAIATIVGVLIPILGALNAVLLANPVVLIIMAIVAAIALLVAAGIYLYKNWDTIKEKVIELKDNVVAKFTEIKESVTSKISELKEKVTSKITEMKTNAVNKAVELKTNFVNKISEMKQDVIDKFHEIKQGISDKIHEIIEGSLSWGRDIIQGLVDGIKGKIEDVKNAAKDVADAIWEKLHFSEPENGPLADFHTYMPDMIAMMVKGLNDGVSELQAPMTRIASALIPDPNAVYNGSRAEGNAMLSEMSRMMQMYFPMLSGDSNTNVTVVLDGDAKKMFNVVKKEASSFKRSTGMSAFA